MSAFTLTEYYALTNLKNFSMNVFRELSFKKGDVIYIRREIDKNWFEGEHNAMVGLLPSNYVEVCLFVYCSIYEIILNA